MSEIYIIHPDDSNLKFFRKTIKLLKSKANAQYLFLGPANSYHDAFLNTLNNNIASTLIFFCHGEDKSLRGCNRESANRRPFNYGSLVSPTRNLGIFLNKNVFCMACYSSSLGEYAIKAGAKVFLGFGLIKFNVQQKMKKRVVNFTKYEIRKIMEESLLTAILNHHTFNQLSKNIVFLINKRRSELLIYKEHESYLARQASIVLADLARGMVLMGDGSQKLVSNSP